MPSPGGSPFIPPLPDMPGSSPGPVQAPVIPPFSPPQQSAQATPAYQPQFLSPYGTPYPYPMSFPPQAGGPPLPGPPPPSSGGRGGGFSSDYVGYGNQCPGAPPSAAPPGGTPYPHAAQFYPGPPGPPPPQGTPAAQPWGAQQWPGWTYAPPTGPTYPTPLPGQPPYGFSPQQFYWPPAGVPGPPPVPGFGPIPTMGMYPAPPMAAPQASREPQLARGDRFDILFIYGEGTSYGPALKPAHIQALGAHLRVNPLLKPVEDSDSPDRKHLVYNMLFSSTDCHRSGDPIHRSWSAGRNEPATFPRVTHLRLISSAFPWMVDIRASHPALGVTCGDLIDQLYGFLHIRLRKEDYQGTTPEQQRLLKNIYHYNRSRADGVPGGRLGEGLKRVDWLNTSTMFGGIRVNDAFVVAHSGIALPCTLEIVCLEREEGSEPDAAELRARGRSQSRRRTSRNSSAHPPPAPPPARSGATTPV